MSLPIDAPCDASGGQPCLPSCNAAWAFAAYGTSPASSDVLAWSAAYMRLTLPDGSEPDASTELTEQNTIIEVLASYDSYSQEGFAERSYYYTSWIPRPGEPYFVGETRDLDDVLDFSTSDVETPFEHPLRDTAQFLDTPMGCLSNPHRVDDAATIPGPGVPEDPEAASNESPSATNQPEEPATSEDGPLPLFVELSSAACDESAIPDPEASTIVGGHGAEVVVQDADGVQLVVNFGNETVYSTDGPDGVMPRPYSFACDPEVFVGTLDEEF